jgi:tRNA A37 threonylcarbamoyladenosine synthetase subunit TsaC/SUA5/YrdC
MLRRKKIKPVAGSIQLVVDTITAGGLVVFPWGKLERRSLAIMCDSGNPDACKRLNSIKKRSANQTLAINGYPELIPDVAEINESQPLKSAAKRLKIEPVDIISRAMKIGAISFIFEAKKDLPDVVTTKVGNRRTVMIAGEVDDSGAYDFYTQLVRNLHKRNVITAGSSANRTTSGTYHVFQQEHAYKDLSRDVDAFVYHSPLPKKPLQALNLESCTCFNFTVDKDIPEVIRFGSVHPARFNKVFGGYTISKDVKYLPNRERVLDILIKSPLKLLNKLTF